jgi:hypothetical protein
MERRDVPRSGARARRLGPVRLGLRGVAAAPAAWHRAGARADRARAQRLGNLPRGVGLRCGGRAGDPGGRFARAATPRCSPDPRAWPAASSGASSARNSHSTPGASSRRPRPTSPRLTRPSRSRKSLVTPTRKTSLTRVPPYSRSSLSAAPPPDTPGATTGSSGSPTPSTPAFRLHTP